MAMNDMLPHDEENHKQSPILTKQALQFCF